MAKLPLNRGFPLENFEGFTPEDPDALYLVTLFARNTDITGVAAFQVERAVIVNGVTNILPTVTIAAGDYSEVTVFDAIPVRGLNSSVVISKIGAGVVFGYVETGPATGLVPNQPLSASDQGPPGFEVLPTIVVSPGIGTPSGEKVIHTLSDEYEDLLTFYIVGNDGVQLRFYDGTFSGGSPVFTAVLVPGAFGVQGAPYLLSYPMIGPGSIRVVSLGIVTDPVTIYGAVQRNAS